jgi:hypothetical protein
MDRSPTLAAAGLGVVVGFVALLPLARDPAVVEALEVADGAVPAATASAAEQPPSPVASATTTAASSSATAKTSILPEIILPTELAPTEQLDRANTVDALRALSEKHPKDPKVLTKLVKTASVAPGGLHEATITARRLFELQPKSANSAEMQAVIKRAASGQPATSDIALDIMASSMGFAGPDILFEMSNVKSLNVKLRERMIELTRTDSVRKLATPQLRIALDLRDKTACDRATLFAEAEKTADGRSLQYLTPLQAKKGCGLFRLADCYPCLGNRGPLNKAIQGIKQRAGGR